MATLTEIYEQRNIRNLTTQVRVAGLEVPYHLRPFWDFSGGPGTVPVAGFDVLHPRPAWIVEGATVLIRCGFEGITTECFVGTVNNISLGSSVDHIDCVGSSNGLKITYRRQVMTLASVDATTAITNLLQGAGVTNYLIDLPAWTIGTVTPGDLEFENYGDAINEIAIVDGNPFYEMPNGQTRIELRDPIPSASSFRTYYSGNIAALTPAQRLQAQQGSLPLTALQPAGVTNPDLQPRLRSANFNSLYSDVKNSVIVLGAVVTTTTAAGTQDSQRLEADLSGPSPWVPTPPGVQEISVTFDLIDDITKLTNRGIREFGLQNRLVRYGGVLVDGDPEIFYGATVQILDPAYTGEVGNFFVRGYKTTVTDTDFTTELTLTGGPRGGTSPLIAPFACFTWAVTGKVVQVLPVGIGPGNSGVVVTMDGTCSRDFDGQVVSYAWSDTLGNVGTDPFFQAAYDPASVSSVDVTLVVTDDTGLTGTTTKTVSVSGDDTGQGGQQTVPTYIFVAAEEYMMGSLDGGKTWNDIPRAAAGVTGKFVECSPIHFGTPGDTDNTAGAACLFITDLGELVVTVDVCVTSFKPTYLNTGAPVSIQIISSTAEFQAVPILGPAAACWFIIRGTGQFSGQADVLFFTKDQQTLDADGWYMNYVNGLDDGVVVHRVGSSPQPDPSWVDIQDQIRASL